MVTIPSSTRSVTYAPVASVGPFPVPFPLFEGSGADIQVTLDGAVASGWTFAGENDGGFYGAPNTWINGSVSFAAPVSGTLVIKGRRTPQRQGQYAEGRGIPARDHNTEYNLLTAVDQELRRDVDNAVMLPEDRLGKFLFFDANGNPVAVSGVLYQPDFTTVAASQSDARGLSRNDVLMSPLRVGQAVGFNLGITRAEIATRFIPVNGFVVTGETVAGDLGAGALYLRGTSGGLRAIQDAAGTWWNLSIGGSCNVGHFGAKGDDSTNDRAAIQAAEDARGTWSELVFPAGVFRVGSAVNITKSGRVRGTGWGSKLVATTVAADILSVSAQQVSVEHLSFASTVTRTGGNYVNVLSTANRFRMADFAMDGAQQGILLSMVATATIERGQMFNFVASTGIGIRVDNGFDVTIRDVILDGPAEILAGIYVANSGDIGLEDLQLINAGQALYVEPAAGQAVTSLWANNCFFDNATRGAYLHANGGNIQRCVFDQCWFSSHLNQGVLLSAEVGSGINGIEFNGCHFFDNAAEGLNINDPRVTNVSVNGGAIAQNVAGGIIIGSGVDGFAIRNARIGATHGFGGNNGGISFLGSADNFMIVNNDLRGNSITPIFNPPAATASKLYEHNLT